jgi:hypothetical protein
MNNFLPKYRFCLSQMCRLQTQSSALWPCYNCPLTHSRIIYIPTHNLQPCFRYTGYYVCTDRFVIYGYQTVSSTNCSYCNVVVLRYTKIIPLTTVTYNSNNSGLCIEEATVDPTSQLHDFFTTNCRRSKFMRFSVF